MIAHPFVELAAHLSSRCSGRKLAGLGYVLTYGLSCVTKHFSNYWVLMLGRFFLSLIHI